MLITGRLFDTYCSFCESIYGGSHTLSKNSLGYDVLTIVNGHDHFRICLADKIQFDKYDLYHRNWGERLGGGYNWHRQARFYDIGYAIFSAYSHALGKELNLQTLPLQDYQRLLADFKESLYIR